MSKSFYPANTRWHTFLINDAVLDALYMQFFRKFRVKNCVRLCESRLCWSTN